MNWSMGGSEYPYFAIGHERIVELPFGASVLSETRPGDRILEVGNTLQRWYDSAWPTRDIVDRHEPWTAEIPVHRCDILNWAPPYRYDVVVSLSTFEHVGHDGGEEDDNGKAQRAVEHCLGLLAPGGVLAFTIPCGWHQSLEDWVVERFRLWEAEVSLMVRDAENRWVERPLVERVGAAYPCEWGNAGKVLFVKHRVPAGPTAAGL